MMDEYSSRAFCAIFAAPSLCFLQDLMRLGPMTLRGLTSFFFANELRSQFTDGEIRLQCLHSECTSISVRSVSTIPGKHSLSPRARQFRIILHMLFVVRSVSSSFPGTSSSVFSPWRTLARPGHISRHDSINEYCFPSFSFLPFRQSTKKIL